MPIRLTDLLKRVPPEVEVKVKRVRDQTRSILQEALRTECRLAMRTPEDGEVNRPGAQVSVEVLPGHPAILKEVSFPDDFQRIMLIGRFRSALQQASAGSTGMIHLREQLLQMPGSERWVRATEGELMSVNSWADELLRLLDQHDALRTVLAIEEDFLGVYSYDASNSFADEYEVNRASIRLYWGVIGLVSEWLGCTVEDLTIVVLTHELAHAYTQVGADIEARRWPAPEYAKAEIGLIEGLAQYYTDRVLNRLERRYPGARKVYESMLPGQPEAYRTHLPWVHDCSPEAVRRAMLEVRRWKEGKLSDFNRRVAEAQKELHPEKQAP